MRFSFSHAQKDQRELLHKWLKQPYINEWIHGTGLNNTLVGLENFFQGSSDATYWMGYVDDTPFAFLVTFFENEETITLDLFICDLNYLGKGLAEPMIRDFLLTQFPNVKTVLIDPEQTNKRAIRVYEKVGFKIIGEFMASWHPVPHYQMSLEMKDLLHPLSKITKNIVVEPYHPKWPQMFQHEATKIQEALETNCVAIHHVGSTSVPGLLAKPVIDIIGVVKDPEWAIKPLENLGYTYKGEYNIPLRHFFNRTDFNLHVYPEGHPEIELNLLFRDYLRTHPEALREYAELKQNLLKEKSAYEKNNGPFTGYNLGKNTFIRKISKATKFNSIRVVKCTHFTEWEAAKRLRQKYFFDPSHDPYTWTFNLEDHAHLILYQGNEIIGYAHIQFWPNNRAALRIIVIDELHRHQSFGTQFLQLCELWLKKQKIHSFHTTSRPSSLGFYQKNGYTAMPFNDPSGIPISPSDISLGKSL